MTYKVPLIIMNKMWSEKKGIGMGSCKIGKVSAESIA